MYVRIYGYVTQYGGGYQRRGMTPARVMHVLMHVCMYVCMHARMYACVSLSLSGGQSQ